MPLREEEFEALLEYIDARIDEKIQEDKGHNSDSNLQGGALFESILAMELRDDAKRIICYDGEY